MFPIPQITYSETNSNQLNRRGTSYNPHVQNRPYGYEDDFFLNRYHNSAGDYQTDSNSRNLYPRETKAPTFQGYQRMSQDRSPTRYPDYHDRYSDNRKYQKFNEPEHRDEYDYPNGNYFTPREDIGLKVRSFSPRETDWYAYKSYFESMAAQANWSNRTKVIKLMGTLPGNLTGITAEMKQPVLFSELMNQLDAVHGLANSEDDALLKLDNCKREVHESLPMFGERVRQMVERAFPTTPKPFKDKLSLRSFLQGLPVKNNFKFHMEMKEFNTLPEAVAYGIKYEQRSKSNQIPVENSRIQASRSVQLEHNELADLVQNAVKQVVMSNPQNASDQKPVSVEPTPIQK